MWYTFMKGTYLTLFSAEHKTRGDIAFTPQYLYEAINAKVLSHVI